MPTKFVDRIPEKPNRFLITPENGDPPYYAYVHRADDASVEGTPLNAATFNNLLTKADRIQEQNKAHDLSVWVGTQAEYDAIEEKDETRLYIISDDTATEDLIKKYSAPHNLLDNSDFTNPVNQRGKTSVTGDGFGFDDKRFIDRWIFSTFEQSTATITPSGIHFGSTESGNTFMTQRFKLGTFDVNKKSYTRVTYYSDGTVDTYVLDPNSDGGYYGFIRDRDGYTEVVFIIETPDGEKTVSYVALYEGIYTADNVPAYKPKGYAVELAECQRYYNKIVSAVLNGYITASARDLFVQIPCAQMIKAPTFSFSGAFTVRTLTGYSNIAHETTPSTYKHVATNSVGVRVSLGWGELITELDANQGKYYDYGETLGVVADINNTPAALHTGIIELSAEY